MTITGLTHGNLFLPEPEPREVKYTAISVDDHLIEPPGMFGGRLPEKHQDLAPRVITSETGEQVWEFDGERFHQIGMAAIAGRRPLAEDMEPARFDHMRPGCYEIEARIHDMDLNGGWASRNFPSQITGFWGRVFSTASDPDLGLEVTRAWNDWPHDEWWQPHPDRIVPLELTFLPDDPARGSLSNPLRGRRAGNP